MFGLKRAIALTALLVTPAGAGLEDTVRFDPPVAIGGSTARLDVYLAPQVLHDIQGADILFFSDTVHFDFTYSDEWLAAMANVPPAQPADLGLGRFEIFATGNNPAGPIGASEILFGTIVADDSFYRYGGEITVDGTLDGFSQILLGAFGEPAVGTAVAYLHVPEPACLALFLAGAMVAGCRGTRFPSRKRGDRAHFGRVE